MHECMHAFSRCVSGGAERAEHVDAGLEVGDDERGTLQKSWCATGIRSYGADRCRRTGGPECVTNSIVRFDTGKKHKGVRSLGFGGSASVR
jgi:hypothetical protein